MKKVIFAAVILSLMFSGCVRKIDESRLHDLTDDVKNMHGITETQIGNGDAKESSANVGGRKAAEEFRIVLPDVVYSIREAALEWIPEGLELNENLSEAIACSVLELTGTSDVTARVTSIIDPNDSERDFLYAYYELYPKGAAFCSSNLLDAFMQAKIVIGENGDYVAGEQYINPSLTKALEDSRKYLASNLTEPGKSDFVYLDSESRICISQNGEFYTTDLYYKGNIGSLTERCMVKRGGDSIILLSCEDTFYASPFRITVSRDGGMTWHTDIPELAPIGKYIHHAELGFTAAEIQFMPDGQIYIFIGTNLASMTVLTVEAGETEASVLFREQIGGYETTALVNAAMVNENRGFYTLAHPKYTASNAIYRTTDGGNSWVRCSVPMPEECTDPWSMTLYLPYQPDGAAKHEWHMYGEWFGGACTFVSYDGGWSWNIE